MTFYKLRYWRSYGEEGEGPVELRTGFTDAPQMMEKLHSAPLY